VAISRTVQQRIRECYGRQSVVIPPPVDVDFYTPAGIAREDFYLCVSALVPYKRIDLAIEACQKLRRRLVIVGAGPLQRRLARRAGPMIRFLGWRSNEEIRDLLRRCRALIFPGCEDFGIVPVEAQACGSPVIAFARGGATETVETGVFFNEQTVECLCEELQRLESSRDRFCPLAARRQAIRFSTQRFRHDLTTYLRRVAEARASDDDTRPAVRSNRVSGTHVAA
jgi:glycosyltransferase involved in cell wall biosynthesis